MSKPGNHSTAWESHDWDQLRNPFTARQHRPHGPQAGPHSGATAAAIHRLRHGLIKPSRPPQQGAKFTSYTREQMQELDRLTHRETRRVKRRARTLFNIVLFGLRFTISKKERRHE